MGTSCGILLVFQFQRRKGSIAPPRGPPKVISSFGCDSERSSKRMDSEKPEQIRTKRAWQSRGARGGGSRPSGSGEWGDPREKGGVKSGPGRRSGLGLRRGSPFPPPRAQ